MRLRKRPPEQPASQLPLFDNASRAEWPVHAPGVVAERTPLLSSTSDETGGPLNAIEAGRVISRQSIRFAGHLFLSGRLHCRGCAYQVPWPDGNGYRYSVFVGTPVDELLGRCAHCNAEVVGEDPRHPSQRAKASQQQPTEAGAVPNHRGRSGMALRRQAPR